LLITPGILTDVFGFSLLIPQTRRLYRRWIINWFKSRFIIEPLQPQGSHPADNRPTIIDSYVVEKSDEDDA